MRKNSPAYVKLPNGKITLIAYLIPAVVFTAIFWYLYNLETLFFYLDTYAMDFRSMFETAVCVLITVITIKSQIKFLGVLLCVSKANNEIESIKQIGYGFAIDGEQNAGKSFMLGYIASVLTPVRFDELELDYYLDFPFVNELAGKARNGDSLPYDLYKTRKDALTFYKSHNDYIPLVYSSNGLKLHGKESQQLQREHLTGEKRQPENSINLHDEVAQMFPNTQRTVAKDEDDEFKINSLNANTSCERQRYGGINLLGEQRFGEVNLSLRTTSGIRRHLIAREVLYRSKFVGKLLKHFENKVLDRQEKTSKRLSKTVKRLKQLDRKIGFHCVYYVDGVGPESVALNSTNLRSMILYCDCDFDYAHRYYFKEYTAVTQKLEFSPSVNKKES